MKVRGTETAGKVLKDTVPEQRSREMQQGMKKFGPKHSSISVLKGQTHFADLWSLGTFAQDLLLRK